MSFTQDQKEQLSKPLDGSLVKQRTQSNVKLSYIEGHEAIRAMNRIFGPDGWDRFTEDMRLVQQEVKGQGNDAKNYVGYVCMARIVVDRVTRQGWGFGQGIDRDLGRAHESAAKEAETDAFKRAAMTFGDPLGLALYDKEQKNVEKAKQEPVPPKPRTGTLDESAPFGWRPEKMPAKDEQVKESTPKQEGFFAEHCARHGIDKPMAFRSFLCRSYGLEDPHGHGGNSLGIDFLTNAPDEVILRAVDAYLDALKAKETANA